MDVDEGVSEKVLGKRRAGMDDSGQQAEPEADSSKKRRLATATDDTAPQKRTRIPRSVAMDSNGTVKSDGLKTLRSKRVMKPKTDGVGGEHGELLPD